jgi:hypothetical protein
MIIVAGVGTIQAGQILNSRITSLAVEGSKNVPGYDDVTWQPIGSTRNAEDVETAEIALADGTVCDVRVTTYRDTELPGWLPDAFVPAFDDEVRIAGYGDPRDGGCPRIPKPAE